MPNFLLSELSPETFPGKKSLVAKETISLLVHDVGKHKFVTYI